MLVVVPLVLGCERRCSRSGVIILRSVCAGLPTAYADVISGRDVRNNAMSSWLQPSIRRCWCASLSSDIGWTALFEGSKDRVGLWILVISANRKMRRSRVVLPPSGSPTWICFDVFGDGQFFHASRRLPPRHWRRGAKAFSMTSDIRLNSSLVRPFRRTNQGALKCLLVPACGVFGRVICAKVAFPLGCSTHPLGFGNCPTGRGGG